MKQLSAGSFCFLLSFLAKETAITFLAIIPLIFFLYMNENKKRAVYITIATTLTAFICLMARFMVLSHYQANNISEIEFMDNALAKPGLPYGTRIATAILISGDYAKLLFIPYPLICDYSYNSIPFANFNDSGVIMSITFYFSLVFFCVIRLLNGRKDYYAFSILFFLITLSLVSNILFLIGTTMGERLLFFPSAGFCLLMALLLEKLVGEKEKTAWQIIKHPGVLWTLIPASVIYVFITINRNNNWSNNYTLYSTDIKKSPGNSRLNYFMAIELNDYSANEEKDPVKQTAIREEAKDYAKKALAIYPGYANANIIAGIVFFNLGQYDSSLLYLHKALAINPGNAVANNDIGNVFYELGKMDSAKKYQEIVQKNNQALVR